MSDELQFQSLTDYYRSRKAENISLFTKVALEEQVSFAYEWLVHKYMKQETEESLNFATYVCLIQTEPEYYGNCIEYIIDKIGVSEEIVELCLFYIRSGVIPYKIWIDKLLADVNNSEYYRDDSIPGLLLVYLNMAMRTSLIGYLKAHKALCEAGLPEDVQSAVDLAYTMYMSLPKAVKDDYMKLFKSEKEADRIRLSDCELNLFSLTLIDMVSCPISLDKVRAIESGELPSGAIFWDEPMGGVPREFIVNKSRAQVLKPDEVISMEDFNDEPEEIEEETEFVVEKVAKHGSNRVMSRRSFTSKIEAENFIEDVINAVPSITESFVFTINKVPYKGKQSA